MHLLNAAWANQNIPEVLLTLYKKAMNIWIYIDTMIYHYKRSEAAVLLPPFPFISCCFKHSIGFMGKNGDDEFW